MTEHYEIYTGGEGKTEHRTTENLTKFNHEFVGFGNVIVAVPYTGKNSSYIEIGHKKIEDKVDVTIKSLNEIEYINKEEIVILEIIEGSLK